MAVPALLSASVGANRQSAVFVPTEAVTCNGAPSMTENGSPLTGASADINEDGNILVTFDQALSPGTSVLASWSSASFTSVSTAEDNLEITNFPVGNPPVTASRNDRLRGNTRMRGRRSRRPF